jgi:hypothetical protein
VGPGFGLNDDFGFFRWYKARQDFYYLKTLNDQELSDIGLTRADLSDDFGLFDDPTARFQARREERLNKG